MIACSAAISASTRSRAGRRPPAATRRPHSTLQPLFGNPAPVVQALGQARQPDKLPDQTARSNGRCIRRQLVEHADETCGRVRRTRGGAEAEMAALHAIIKAVPRIRTLVNDYRSRAKQPSMRPLPSAIVRADARPAGS